MARTILLTRRDWVREPGVGFYGGNWVTPFSVLIEPRPQSVMQAISPEPENTTFDVDLLNLRSIGLFHFQRLAVTNLAIIRLQADVSGSFLSPAYDTGWTAAWPQDKAAMSNSVWGELSMAGTYEQDEYVALGMPRFFIPTAPITARYIRVEIQDQTAITAAQIGYFGACETWEPEHSPDFGWSIDFLDESDVQTVPYGSRWIISRGKRRRLNLGFSWIGTTEFQTKALGWAAMIGKSRPVAISVFPDDTANVEKTSVWGTLVNDIQISNPYFAQYRIPMQLEQLI
jgi:hypothetical protein